MMPEKDKYLEPERRDFWVEMYKLAYKIFENPTSAAKEADDALALFDKKFGQSEGGTHVGPTDNG